MGSVFGTWKMQRVLSGKSQPEQLRSGPPPLASDVAILVGNWKGTMANHQANLAIRDENGRMLAALNYPAGVRSVDEELSIEISANHQIMLRRTSYRLNRISTSFFLDTLDGQIQTEGPSLVGTWRDAAGRGGNWSMTKVSIQEQPHIAARALTTETATTSQAVPVPMPFEEAEQSAERAFQQGRLIEPSNDSALYWARRAKQLGDPNVGSIEHSVLDTELALVESERKSGDYGRALTLINQLQTLFPGHRELQQRSAELWIEKRQYAEEQERVKRETEEQQRYAVAYQVQTKRFTLRPPTYHRHRFGAIPKSRLLLSRNIVCDARWER
jgi:hypothetical protein